MGFIQDKLDKIYDVHDIGCNQKYNKIYPYSLHLKAVVSQAEKYAKDYFTPGEILDILVASAGHDLIEDVRWTYNDVKEEFGEHVANIIYACTEEKGKNRKERHSDKFFNELRQYAQAVFVKLCDQMANVLFSLLTNSSMYEKYQKEFPNFYQKLHINDEYEKVWDDLRELLKM